MIKVKETKQISAKYELVLDVPEARGDDAQPGMPTSFEFEILLDGGEWVLQGEGERNGRGARYSQAELTAITDVLTKMNKKK